MSDYFKKLDGVSQSRYVDKLKLLDLTEKEDSYSSENSSKFVDDMSKWPPVEYGHIFCYYIDRPGVYTRRQLKQWKSLEAYNYFQSGHVREVKVWPVSSMYTILMAYVNPSQRSPDKAHQSWVGVRKDGEIIAIQCTCMAGLGEGCSHSAAIMFKVECAVRNGYTSVTSNPCSWNQVFSKKHQPSRIIDIKFTKPKQGFQLPSSTTSSAVNLPTQPTHEEKEEFLTQLNVLAPNCAVLSSCYEQVCEKHPSLPSLPPTIMSLSRLWYRDMDQDELVSTCKGVFEEVIVTDEEADFLFQSTLLQADSLVWHEHRKGRLTASKFGAICHTSVVSPSKSLIDSILQRKSFPKTAAMKWGIENEAIARKEYVENAKLRHVSFECENSGLYVNPKSPHLGASPDGLICCGCCGLGLLEIKCPFSVKHTVPTAASFMVSCDDGFQLSRKHNYYFQIQGQMAVFERCYCDFVCWTPFGLHVERILYDSDFVSVMMPKLDSFFVDVILPQVLCEGEGQSALPPYCICQRGESGKMIQCDSPYTEFSWFHYTCLNIPEAFEPDYWLCPDCTKMCAHLDV